MNTKQLELSRGNLEKPVLEQLLKELNLDYNRFSDYLGIDRITLWQYRTGKREFRLTMEQVHKLEALLEKVGWRLRDLPSDWIRTV